MKRFFLFFLATSFFVLIFPSFVYSRIGVGVGTGKIVVDEKLKPGMIYKLPSLTILNTGDEESDYEAAITYHEKQKQLRPPQEWFEFSPSRFHLEPGDVQQVAVNLTVPLKVEPGDYFAYLEGHPVKKDIKGQTSIGVAAAAKLYFTILPANFFVGIYYRILTFGKLYQPWTNRIIILIAVVTVYWLLNRLLGLKISLGKGKNRKKESDE